MSNEHNPVNTLDVKDPVCGMSVTEESEYHAYYNESNYYFCSQGCEDKFKASPDSYLNPVPLKSSTCQDDS